jgi:N-acetylmuramoyl-L-alanine amidase
MRRLLLVPALALVLLGTPVLALETPEPPPTTTTSIPLTPEDSAPETTTTTTAAPTTTAPPTTTPARTDATVQEGWESKTTPVDATLVGVTWDGDPDASFTIDVRSDDGSWDTSTALESTEGADSGTRDAARAEAFPDHASDPVWVGFDTAAVRVTLEEGAASNVAVAAVDSEPAPAPDGAAGAITGTFGSVDGTSRWFFGGALLVVVALLVALAFGLRIPGRRRGLLAIALGSLLLAACVPVTAPAPSQPSPASTAVSNGSYPLQPAIVSRASWGARPFACSAVEYAPALKFAVVHHTVNSNSYGPGDSAAIVRGIQNYHLDALGYCDIAYHFLIDRFGRTFEGRAGGITKPVIGGHAGGFNTGSVGVAMIGDLSAVQPAGDQWNSLVNILRWRLSIARINPSAGFTTTVRDSPCGCMRWPAGTQVSFPNAILSHREVDFTECPGNAFAPRMGELRNVVQWGIQYPQ